MNIPQGANNIAPALRFNMRHTVDIADNFNIVFERGKGHAATFRSNCLGQQAIGSHQSGPRQNYDRKKRYIQPSVSISSSPAHFLNCDIRSTRL